MPVTTLLVLVVVVVVVVESACSSDLSLAQVVLSVAAITNTCAIRGVAHKLSF